MRQLLIIVSVVTVFTTFSWTTITFFGDSVWEMPDPETFNGTMVVSVPRLMLHSWYPWDASHGLGYMVAFVLQVGVYSTVTTIPATWYYRIKMSRIYANTANGRRNKENVFYRIHLFLRYKLLYYVAVPLKRVRFQVPGLAGDRRSSLTFL